MNPFFSALSLAYIAGIFLLADSPMVFSAPTFNPYSILHIPLYGILTILLILSFPPFQTNPDKQSDLFRFQIAGLIALVVAIADEIHQAYNPSRNASITDVLLDFIGIILCILLIRRIQRNEKIPSPQNNRTSRSFSAR
jgi:VanZ family protein